MSSVLRTGRHAAPTAGRDVRRGGRRRRKARGRGAALLGLAGGLSLTLSAGLALQARDPAAGVVPGRDDVGAVAGTLRGTVPATQAGAPSSVRLSPAAFVPERVEIPRLSVTAPVVAVAVDQDRSLGVPEDPSTLGWWRGGAWPGSPVGSVVVDGHVDSAQSGPGALFDLRSLEPGDVITVTGQGHSTRYVVSARRQYAKTALPPTTFDQDVAARLVLITCGGRFDHRTRHYDDNVVVFASPA